MKTESFRKKLIEVAIPLDAINKEAALRKRKAPAGYPTTIHKWWAQRPIAACNAILFASLVDDPSSDPERFPTEEIQDQERERLFDLMREMITWENLNDPRVVAKGREAILRSSKGTPPAVYDPFAGGGSIPLESQRLGLPTFGSDLNPVAVLITKALVEFPAVFSNRQPVRPANSKKLLTEPWRASKGLAEDIRFYGRLVKDEAEKRLAQHFPMATLPDGSNAPVVAWLWARTIVSPDPAARGARTPLIKSFTLCSKKGRMAWVEPVIGTNGSAPSIQFDLETGDGKPRPGTVNRRGATCIFTGTPIPFDYIRKEGKAGRIGVQLMAIVVETKNGRKFLPPSPAHEELAASVVASWRPEADLPHNPRDFKTPNYGMKTFGDLFTTRQLLALTTFSDLITEIHGKVREDAILAGMDPSDAGLANGGSGATAYADAITVYLSFAANRQADYGNTLSSWRAKDNAMRSGMAKQALPMVWDFAEGNPFGPSSAGFIECVEVVAKCVGMLPEMVAPAVVGQVEAQRGLEAAKDVLICTDPPYYDNIGYADLSDFFFVWLRRTLGSYFPELCATLLVPKAQELVATPYRFEGDKSKAKNFFENGLGQAFDAMRQRANPEYPIVVYYAFKQSESEDDDEDDNDDVTTTSVASTGWETMLEGLLNAGFCINGTWPIRTEGDNRQIGIGNNALASSIVLVCRLRPADAKAASRRDFLSALKRELPASLRNLQQGNIAPVDLAQASIGPGMAIFSRYSRVLEADGSSMKVRTALSLINLTLDEVLSEQEGEFDSDTRWALAWFEQFGMNEGLYGEAETLSKAKNTSVSGLEEAGILNAKAGKVRLLKRNELRPDYDPDKDPRCTHWEVVQYIIRALDESGETGAAEMHRKFSARAEVGRDLAYRLYTVCERKGWSQEAIAYNSLVVAWPEITKLSSGLSSSIPVSPESGQLELKLS